MRLMPSVFVGDDDRALLAAARGGDAEAFRMLWTPVERQAFGLCFHLTENRSDALDALQETQIAAWKGLGAFEGRASFKVWVMAIARNAALAVVRRRRSHADLLFPDVAEPQAVESGFDDTVARLVDLRRALATLTPAHREALLLWAGGLTYEQTAAVLEVPINTVKVWIFRGRKSLKELLEA
jgi:RNA polymerase sigma-70 factor (ECF subfamily)